MTEHASTDPAGIDREDEELALSDTVPGRDGGPIDEDDMAAADGLEASPETAENYEELIEKGAQSKGEGRVP